MTGGDGNDTYFVDNTGDIIVEIGGSFTGTDTVNSSATYTLANHIENLALTGMSAINGTGNTYNNILTGNTATNILDSGLGDDTLNGGTGNDSMNGGDGNDTYFVDSTGDKISDSSGTDTVNSSVTFILDTGLENLNLTGTMAINGTGNTLDNMLIGNIAANILSGGDGNDMLNGGAGADSMNGGSGNDVYFVDNIGDKISDIDGIDTINSSVTFTLAGSMENLKLTGTAIINGTGNALDNFITGNEAANTLRGGAGNDTIDGGFGNDIMMGETGNDTYLFKTGSDSISDSAGEDALIFDIASYDSSSIDIAIFKSGTDVIFDIGNNNQIKVTGQTVDATRVEMFKLSGGEFLTSGDVNKVIQDMTSFASTHGIAMNNITDVKNNEDLMNIINMAWNEL